MSKTLRFLLGLGLLAYLPDAMALDSHVESSGEQAKGADQKANAIMRDLYITLRSIALPNSPNSNKKVTQRFVLMSPGKVLNFFDYYPGEQYERSVQDISTSTKEYVVPPKVMENWFDLADVVPGVDPLTGGESGESLSQRYQTVLNQVEIKGFSRKTAEERKRYKNAVDYLNEVIPDPENLTQNVTRLALYNRYQDMYNQRRLQMEDMINEKRNSMPAIEYELWFQRQYPSLQSLVESAYTSWLVFGQKDIIELYKAYFDTGLSGQYLEVARSALRASGVSSLDRTRTIYPVNFVPSDWYKYLLPSRQQGLSRDQLQMKVGLIKSKIEVLKSILKHQNEPTQVPVPLTSAKKNYSDTKDAVEHAVTDLMEKRAWCIGNGTKSGSQDCENFQSAQENTTNALFQLANKYSEWQTLDFFLNSTSLLGSALQGQIDQLNQELGVLEDQLIDTFGYLGDIAESKQLEFSNLTDNGRDDEWLQFNFDSQSSEEDTEQESTSFHVATSFSYAGLFSVGGSYGHTEASYAASIASARLKASGELLRVQILRPWFRPTLFEDPSLSFSITSPGGKKAYVSPGYSSEQDFTRLLMEDSTVSYLLPEYATSFLLARNIDLEFSGLDASTTSHILQTSVQTSVSFGFGLFSGSVSFGYNHQRSSLQAKRTADGVKISIPGAQVIGYFTEVVPKFPTDQN